MKTYKVLVWHDYTVSDTYAVEVQAVSEEEAMQRAVEEVKQGNGVPYSDHVRMDESFEASENSIEEVE